MGTTVGHSPMIEYITLNVHNKEIFTNKTMY